MNRNHEFYFLIDKSMNLWSSVSSVSNQGAKKGRGRGRSGNLKKNLNVGQEIGTGKLN